MDYSFIVIKTGVLSLALPDLMAGKRAGRQNTAKFKIVCILDEIYV